MQIPAGVEVHAFRLQSPEDLNYSWGVSPRLLLVRNLVDEQGARRGACLNALTPSGSRVGPQQWTQDPGVQAVSTVQGELQPDSTFLPLNFRDGGEYALCFSKDTNFDIIGDVDLLPITLLAMGAYDWHCADSAVSPCLPTRVQFCYLLQGAYSPSGSCEVTFNWKELCANDVGIVGDPDAMKISWTAEWPVVVSSGVVSSEARTCGTLVSAGSADFLCLDGDRCDVGDSFVDLDANGSAFLPRGRGNLRYGSDLKGYSTTLCLCPMGSCLQPDLFTQQIGIVHFFAVSFCWHVSSGSDGCIGSFSSILAFYPMRLEVLCPGDLCGPDPNSARLKITRSSDILPSWDAENGCLGMQTYLQTSPLNCISQHLCTLTGGTLQDLKVFGNGTEGQVKLNLSFRDDIQIGVLGW